MVSVKKKTKFRPSKRLIILFSIASVALLLIGGLRLSSYVLEKQVLTELSRASSELKVVYNNIVENNKGNILSSYFRDNCSIGHTSWLEERVSCGPSGRIVLKSASEIDLVQQNLSSSTKNSVFSATEPVVNDVSGKTSAGIDLESSTVNTNCYAGYGKNQLDNNWYYWMTCRKDVRSVLPGYTVEE